MRFPCCALLAVAACASPHPAAPAAPATHQVAALGETWTIDSKVLGERRVINVYVPPGYATSDARYPVLYMPDGGLAEDFPHVAGSVDVSIKNEVIRPAIVVGIENTERRRDLVAATAVPEEREVAPHAGGSERFRRFLRDELIPAVDAHYRTTHERLLIGESFAGLFVVETLLLEPDLFDGYIAVDPSLWWNQQALVRDSAVHLAGWTAGAKALYVATADYAETQQAVAVLLDTIAITSAPIAVTYEPMPAEHHNTIFAIAALRGIRALLAVQ